MSMRVIVTGPTGSGKSTMRRGLVALASRNNVPVASFDFRELVRSSRYAARFLAAMQEPVTDVVLEVDDGMKSEFAVWLHERMAVNCGADFAGALTLFDQHVRVDRVMSYTAVRNMRYWEGGEERG